MAKLLDQIKLDMNAVRVNLHEVSEQLEIASFDLYQAADIDEIDDLLKQVKDFHRDFSTSLKTCEKAIKSYHEYFIK